MCITMEKHMDYIIMDTKCIYGILMWVYLWDIHGKYPQILVGYSYSYNISGQILICHQPALRPFGDDFPY